MTHAARSVEMVALQHAPTAPEDWRSARRSRELTATVTTKSTLSS